MQAIWKYPLKIVDSQTIDMPHDARILSAANQDGALCLWAMVDTSPGVGTRQPRHIRIVGTGNPIADARAERLELIDTVLMPPYVWHVFEYDRPIPEAVK